MSELGEPVAVGAVDTDDWECPFEHDKPGTVQNDLANSSSKLGTRVTNGWSTQLWEEKSDKIDPKINQPLVTPVPEDECPAPPVRVGDEDYPYSRSAHHLIPADAALPRSHLIHFIKQGAKIRGDIGYDVNGADNGIWLPTHTALSSAMKKGRVLPGMVFGIKYGDLSALVDRNQEENTMMATFQQRFAYQVMERTSRQFHDAHLDYSDFVVKALNKIFVNLINISNYNCTKCQQAKSGGGKLPPPHRLVFRLNELSRRLRGFLTGNPLGWRRPLFTSRFAQDLAADARIWSSPEFRGAGS